MNDKIEYGLRDDDLTITLTLDDDSELVCAVLAIFPAGERDYIALLPEGEDAEVFLYRFGLSPDGAPILDNIEDDAEYEKAGEAFEALEENEG